MIIRRLGLILLLFTISHALFSQDLVLSSAERLWLESHPVIHLGVGTSYPPIQYVHQDSGRYEFSGIASDYVKIISELLNVEFVIEYGITFREALEKGRNKEIDMFPCVAYSEERDSFLDFTEGYLVNPIVIFSNEAAPFIGSIKDLSGLRVADVEALYIYKKLKQDVPGIEFVLTEDAEASLESVTFGKADANVAGLISGSYLIQKNNWVNIKVAAPTPYPDTVFRMAVRDDWPELTAIIDKALMSIDDEKRNEIKRKWLPVRYEYGIDQTAVWERLLLVGGISIAAIGLILIWVARLRREISRRRRVEKSLSERELELSKLLEEKELLIREVHHRIKNNLSLVASLINIQASELSTQKDIEKMKLVVSRIDSIVLLYDKLSISPDLKNIDFSAYLEDLINGIEKTRSDDLSKVDIRIHSVQAAFDSKVIIPLGLIVTELVTNALKYGFTESTSSGLIEVDFKEKPDHSYLLIVRNNGAPLPDKLDLNHLKSIGLMIVQSLVKQIDGELQLTEVPSPEFKISFPAPL